MNRFWLVMGILLLGELGVMAAVAVTDEGPDGVTVLETASKVTPDGARSWFTCVLSGGSGEGVSVSRTIAPELRGRVVGGSTRIGTSPWDCSVEVRSTLWLAEEGARTRGTASDGSRGR